MSFGATSHSFSDHSDEVMSEINMTPLVDVMLVLLIIFMITVPVMKHAVNIDLPHAKNQAQDIKPQTLHLSVDAAGQYFMNEVPASDEAVLQQLTLAAALNPQPELHLRGDKAVRYERVAQAMAAAQRAGIRKIGFVTEPKLPP
jgi:biopolymer transport protein ExbD